MKKLFAILAAFLLSISFPGFSSAYVQNSEVSAVNVKVLANRKEVKFERQPMQRNVRILVPARTFLKELDARVDWYPAKNFVRISKGSTVIKMFIGSYTMSINGRTVKMDADPVLYLGTVMVPVRYTAEGLGYRVTWAEKDKTVYIGGKTEDPSRGEPAVKGRVVIDPGHGGFEPGAVYWQTREKDLNLDMAKRLYRLLRDDGIEAYMTRQNDSYVGLSSRAHMANRMGADLLLSVHNNAGPRGARGSMSLYYPSDKKAKGGLTPRKFAGIVQYQMLDKLGTRNMGIIARPDLTVLRKSTMPAVLAEVGYMSNQSELDILRTSAFRQKAAEALEEAVVRALSEVKK